MKEPRIRDKIEKLAKQYRKGNIKIAASDKKDKVKARIMEELINYPPLRESIENQVTKYLLDPDWEQL